MDLHLTAAAATAEEREAIDAELAGAARRDLLLPTLHGVQRRIGYISQGAVNHIAERLNIAPAEIHGVASFYGMFSLEPRPRTVTHVCDDIVCRLHAAAPSDHSVSCLGLCDRAPAALITESGPQARETIVAGRAAPLPQRGQPQLRLLRRIGVVDPTSLDDYQRLDGYRALRRAIDLGPEAVVREVIESRLLGRGGAAFPTGRKWEALLRQRAAGRTHYVVCNADESEPGTFKDRVVMEGDPFSVIEGMTIAAFATASSKGYFYIRGEYPLAAERIECAIEAARAAGFLGPNILGRGFDFDIELRRGAGAYICGEETALFNSIEGYRGEPRNKPPFPTQAGLFRQPTVVNNVETLINVPEIVLQGGAAYARTGTEQSTGPRLFCLSGHILRPGLYEVPHGTTVRELIALAGGVCGSGRLQAVLLGGAAGTFISPEELDTPLSFEATRVIGATLGSGVVIPLDDTVDLRRVLLRIAAFFREETCGQCVPCRIGVVRQQEALERLIQRRPLTTAADEVTTLRELGQAMRDASICGLGQTASSAVESALSRWSLSS